METDPNEAPDIAALRLQIAQKKALLQKKLAQKKTREKKEARTRDTRRKILAGAIVLQKAQTDPAFAARLFALIDDNIEERNRALFPELPQPES